MEGVEYLVSLVGIFLWIVWMLLPGIESSVEAGGVADGPSWPEEPSEPMAGLEIGELSYPTEGCCGICSK